MKQSIVAMFGAIIPAPFAVAPMVTSSTELEPDCAVLGDCVCCQDGFMERSVACSKVRNEPGKDLDDLLYGYALADDSGRCGSRLEGELIQVWRAT